MKEKEPIKNKSIAHDAAKRGKLSLRKKIREIKESQKWTRNLVSCRCNGICDFSCIKQ